MRISSLFLVLFSLGGCAMFGKSVPIAPPEPTVVTKIETVPLRIYQPPLPAEITLLDLNWFVITSDNLEEKKKDIEKTLDGQFVVFALTPDGYEKMAENLQELRRYLLQQKELVLYYRKSTSESVGTTAEDWVEKNKELKSSEK
jgi:hypothetical protein